MMIEKKHNMKIVLKEFDLQNVVEVQMILDG